MISKDTITFFSNIENIDLYVVNKFCQRGYQVVIFTEHIENAKKTLVFGYTGQIRIISISELKTSNAIVQKIIKNSSAIIVSQSIIKTVVKDDTIKNIILYIGKAAKDQNTQVIYLFSPTYRYNIFNKKKYLSFMESIFTTNNIIQIKFGFSLLRNDNFFSKLATTLRYFRLIFSISFSNNDIVDINSPDNIAEQIVNIYSSAKQAFIFKDSYLIEGQAMNVNNLYKMVGNACEIQKIKIVKFPKLILWIANIASMFFPSRYNLLESQSILLKYFKWKKLFPSKKTKIIKFDKPLDNLMSQILYLYRKNQELESGNIQSKEYYPNNNLKSNYND
jgi:hypothetical protein